jgi:hypothetical protein
MIDIVLQGIFKARLLDRAVDADAPGDFHSHPVAREKCLGRKFPALALRHPAGVQVIDLRDRPPENLSG